MHKLWLLLIVLLLVNSNVDAQATLPLNEIYDAAWSDNGRVLAVALPKALYILRSGLATPVVIPQDGRIDKIALRDDGKLVAVSVYRGSFSVWDTETGLLVNTWKWDSSFAINFGFMPDQKHLLIFVYEETWKYFQEQGQSVFLWNYEDGDTEFLSRVSYSDIFVVNNDGSLLAISYMNVFGSMGPVTPDLLTKPLRSRGWGTYFQNVSLGSVEQILFVPNNPNQLLTIQNYRGVTGWNIETHQPNLVIPHAGEDVTAMAVSSDGRLLYTATDTREVRAWNLQTGRVEYRWPNQPWPIWKLSVQSDGRILAFSVPTDSYARFWAIHLANDLPRVWPIDAPDQVRVFQLPTHMPGPTLEQWSKNFY